MVICRRHRVYFSRRASAQFDDLQPLFEIYQVSNGRRLFCRFEYIVRKH